MYSAKQLRVPRELEDEGKERDILVSGTTEGEIDIAFLGKMQRTHTLPASEAKELAECILKAVRDVRKSPGWKEQHTR